MATLVDSSTDTSIRPLPRLPVELIEQIFSSTDDVKTLATICSVSKLGRRAATPILYKTLGVTSESIDTDNGDSIERAARSLRLQCRTLLENRELAKHVREIRQYISNHIFDQLHDMNIFKPKQCRKVLNHDIKLPSNVVEAVMCSLTANHRTIGGQTDEACFMLLLALCPQATTLRLEGELGVVRAMAHLNGIIQEVCNKAVSARTSLTHVDCLCELELSPVASLQTGRVGQCAPLSEKVTDNLQPRARDPASGYYTVREIHLTKLGEDEEQWIGAQDIVPLLSFPKLEKLTSDFLDAKSEMPWAGETSVNSSVKTIEIEQCWGKADDLEYLFCNCPDLESLSIQWGMREHNYRRFDWRDLGESIREHLPNLKHLSLEHYADHDPSDRETVEMMEWEEDSYMQNAHLPGLGSLKNLTNLETLTLSNIALRGTHNDDQYDPDGFIDREHMWDDSGEDEHGSSAAHGTKKHTLDDLLPESLQELTGK